MTAGNGAFSARNIAAAVLIAGAAASLAMNYPGHMEFDGIMQMAEGHTGIYGNWHPPVMSWLLGISEAVRGDAWLFVLFDTLMSYSALLSLLWLVEKPRAPSIAVALLCAVLPQFFLFGAIVWKDVLFANALLAGFVFLAHAAARWNRRNVRFVCLSSAAIFIALAVLARQSGAVVLPCAAVATGLIAAQNNHTRKAFAYGLGFLVVSAFLCIGGNALLQLRASNALGPIEEFEDLELYDLGGMLQQHPDLPMPILEREAPAMARALRENGPKLYTPAMHDPLTDPPAIHSLIVASVAPVRHQWIASVRANPGLYLSVRAADFNWLFFSLHPDRCLTYTLGVGGPAAQMKMLKLSSRYDDRDSWLEDNYADALIGTPAFSHPFFTFIGVVCLILLLWRRRPADLALAAMLAAAMLYATTYFVIAVACQYRYLFALDTSALAALFYLSMDWPGFSARTRRSNASP